MQTGPRGPVCHRSGLFLCAFFDFDEFVAAGIDYIIPGNDDSGKAIRLYAKGAADAILEGRSASLQEVVKGDSSEEFVEVAAGQA